MKITKIVFQISTPKNVIIQIPIPFCFHFPFASYKSVPFYPQIPQFILSLNLSHGWNPKSDSTNPQPSPQQFSHFSLISPSISITPITTTDCILNNPTKFWYLCYYYEGFSFLFRRKWRPNCRFIFFFVFIVFKCQ